MTYIIITFDCDQFNYRPIYIFEGVSTKRAIYIQGLSEDQKRSIYIFLPFFYFK